MAEPPPQKLVSGAPAGGLRQNWMSRSPACERIGTDGSREGSPTLRCRLSDSDVHHAARDRGGRPAAVLFLLASILSGTAVLPQAKDTAVYLTALGVLLTAVYLVGLIFRPASRILRIGADSLAVLILYPLGIAGFVAIATS